MSLPPVRNPQKLINPLRQRVLSPPLPLEVVVLCSPTSFPAASQSAPVDLGRGLFYQDLERDLEDPEFRRVYEETAAYLTRNDLGRLDADR